MYKRQIEERLIDDHQDTEDELVPRSPVVSGRHLGRTIGIPTANLALPPQLLCPRHGVYAALACFDGRRLPAVVNIGSRPTVGGTHVTVEPWILDFDGDLYGRTLRLEFYTFLRPERKFYLGRFFCLPYFYEKTWTD